MALERYVPLMPRLPAALEGAYQNLVYEGNNPLMRALVPEPSGAAIARRWRAAVERTRAVFVLRDSLFAQQDHPYAHAPFATMLPASWVTAAVAEAMAGRVPRALATFPAGADGAWRALARPADLFGSFPASPTLFRRATTSLCTVAGLERAAVVNARRTLHGLAAEVERMRAAAADGPRAVARAGADAIAASDVRYFGAGRRRRYVIPILVERPTPGERREGKGLVPPGRTDVPPAAVRLAGRAILARRLRDGDAALERVDLRAGAERARAAALLRALVPADGAPGATVWVWALTAGLGDRTLSTGAAVPLIATFARELVRAGVDVTRVRLVHKPDLVLPAGAGLGAALERALDGWTASEALLAVAAPPGALARALESSSAPARGVERPGRPASVP